MQLLTLFSALFVSTFAGSVSAFNY
jgi:transmembrane 9 superfamily protein 2/4